MEQKLIETKTDSIEASIFNELLEINNFSTLPCSYPPVIARGYKNKYYIIDGIKCLNNNQTVYTLEDGLFINNKHEQVLNWYLINNKYRKFNELEKAFIFKELNNDLLKKYFTISDKMHETYCRYFSLPLNIKKYIYYNSPPSNVVRYLLAIPETLVISVNNFLASYSPNFSTLKNLVETAYDKYVSDGLNYMETDNFTNILKNSGIKDAIRSIQKSRSDKNITDKKNIQITSFTAKKKIIYKENKGNFIKNCPCTPGALNCNYYILIPGIGCPYNCSYCFMNSYFEEKNITIYSNTEKMLNELNEFVNSFNGKPVRMGTGEFMDSLAIKEFDEINNKLIKEITKYKNLCFEFKTKSSRIDLFLKHKPCPNIVISWSLNPQWIIDKEEQSTASLKSRLYSAKKIAEYGYNVAFHFDPIFMTPESIYDYEEVVEELFEAIPSEKIQWISMGGFRYMEDLKLAIMENNKSGKWYLSHRYKKCEDGKFRYNDEIRFDFYNKLAKRIKTKSEKIKLYVCMENQNAWNKLLWDSSSILKNIHPLS